MNFLSKRHFIARVFLNGTIRLYSPSKLTKTKIASILITIALNSILTRPLAAATVAYDSAADATYQEGWHDGNNGGYGWGSAWNLNSNSTGEPFSTDANLTLSTMGSGTYATATRSFNGPLVVGQTFKIDWFSHQMTSGARGGIRLENAAGDILFEFRYFGGNGPYTFMDRHSNGQKSAMFSQRGVHLEFTLTSPATLSFSLTYIGETIPEHQSNSRPLVYSVHGFDISQFTIFLEDNSESSQPLIQEFNNFAVVPEPSTMVLLVGGVGLFALTAWRRNNLR